MDANAIATGHYACTTFGDFLENDDAVAGTTNFVYLEGYLKLIKRCYRRK
jgi:hypothetical protein